MEKIKKGPNSLPFFSRYLLKERDEGAHHNDVFKHQEWWYYNVLFNDPKSELKNWSVAISLATFPHVDSVKFIIHDDKDGNYGNIYLKPKGTCKASNSDVDVKIDSSYAIGKYPKWHVYADNKNLDTPEISVDLDFKANSLPMWILKNTGLNLTTSLFGYYCIMNCDAKGEVTIDDKVYKVKGVGYHDHTWMPMLKEPVVEKSEQKLIDFNVWDWLNIHFDNGWDAFIGKIHSTQRFPLTKLLPGSLSITPDGKKLIECYFFNIENLEHQDTSFPSIKIPKKIQIKGLKINPINGQFFIDLFYEIDNVKECFPRDPPSWGQWEATGKVYGEIKMFKKKIKLNGWGIMEITHSI